MTGLGLATAGQIEAGIHLRWTMEAGMGFPPYGFSLYRRAHVPGTPVCLRMLPPPGHTPFGFSALGLTLEADLPLAYDPSYGPRGAEALLVDAPTRITITPDGPLQSFSLEEAHASGTVRLTALDGTTVVDRAASAAPGGAMKVSADRITQVLITTEAGGGFYALCYVPVSDKVGGWGQALATLRLPPDWATAAGRIPEELHPRFKGAFPQLREVIALLDRGPSLYTASGPETPRPTFLVQPVQLLLLAALDPAIARILGLYYLDASAAPGTVYDYKVVGHWSARGAVDHAWICFGQTRGTPPGVVIPSGFSVAARSVSGSASAAQAAAALSWDLPQRQQVGAAQGRGAPVLYHVYRQRRRPSGWAPAEHLTAAQPLLVPADSASGAYPEAQYVDGPIPAGDYRYQVQGVDLFGRSGPRSAPVQVALGDHVPPPPPVQVTVRATRPGGAGAAVSEAADVAVSWRWLAPQRAQASDATRFRVYYQTAGLRPARGTILEVDDLGNGTSDVFTDLPRQGSYARFAGGRLANRGRVFPVQSVRLTGRGVILRVRNLVDPDGAPILPRAAGPDEGREALVFVTHPGAAQGHFSLQADWSRGAQWQPMAREVPLSSAERYAVTLEGIPLVTGPLIPVAYVLVGVSTVDRAGNEGPISSPVAGAVAHAVAPAAPAPITPDPGAGPEYASRADYHGRSRYTVTIGATEPGLRYDVYRALDASILALARKAGETVPADPDDATLLALGGRYPDAFTRLE
ncbi:MAG TPA: hypothetical protein VH257_14920, partial [Chloroflexota bacterium]|nr:hypothetical protein [Chloroflexota bacterium]